MKFLVFHHPMCTSSAHRFDDYNSNGTADRLDVLEAVPLASRYGVQMILAATTTSMNGSIRRTACTTSSPAAAEQVFIH